MIDVVIVGAGVAGLSAAAAAREAGLSSLVVEAGSRIGGRAWTTDFIGAPIDLGAAWLHHGETNPLTPIARQAGDALHDWSASRCERLYVNDRPATPDEADAESAAEARITEFLSVRAEDGPDISLAEAAAPLAEDAWLATTLMWEASIIAAADADVLSLHDWHANLLGGANYMLAEGLGAFVVRRLGVLAGDIRLNTPVRRIRRGRESVVETDKGDIAARAVIVTVSTGVLASGAIEFSPALPVATQAAIDGLPMGLLSKAILPASGPDRLDVPASCSIWRQHLDAGEPAVVLNAWPMGRPYVAGHFGGRTAWANTDPREAETLVRAEWRRLFGTAADHAFGGPALVTDGGPHPLFLGAYAYAKPGHAGARVALGEPIDGGRLVFAGEATHPTLAGTVGGAWLEGRRAVEAIGASINGGA